MFWQLLLADTRETNQKPAKLEAGAATTQAKALLLADVASRILSGWDGEGPLP